MFFSLKGLLPLAMIHVSDLEKEDENVQIGVRTNLLQLAMIPVSNLEKEDENVQIRVRISLMKVIIFYKCMLGKCMVMYIKISKTPLIYVLNILSILINVSYL